MKFTLFPLKNYSTHFYTENTCLISALQENLNSLFRQISNENVPQTQKFPYIIKEKAINELSFHFKFNKNDIKNGNKRRKFSPYQINMLMNVIQIGRENYIRNHRRLRVRVCI